MNLKLEGAYVPLTLIPVITLYILGFLFIVDKVIQYSKKIIKQLK